MRRSLGWWITIALLSIGALLAGLSDHRPPPSPLPSVTNPGPPGLKALFTYLKETGREVGAVTGPLHSALESHAGTLVLAEPTARRYDAQEVDAIIAFVERGGRLVYLAAPREAQPDLEDKLEVERRQELLVPAQQLLSNARDLGTVLASTHGVPGVQQLRMAATEGIESKNAAAVVIAEAARIPLGLFRRMGLGELWVFTNASFAQNARLAEGDNLALWERLVAGGPVLFEEAHHRAASGGALPVGLLVAGLQLLLIGALFAWSSGARLGPARPDLRKEHRSSLEYVASLGALAQASGLELELLRTAVARLRRITHARLGVSTEAGDEELAQALHTQLGIPLEEIEKLLLSLAEAERGGVTPHEYWKLTTTLARVEQQLDRAPSR